MKNIKRIMSILTLTGMLLVTGCGEEKVAVAPDSFISTMESVGATINDQTEVMAEVSSATSVQIAYVEGEYQIEYYEFAEETDAQYLFEASKEQLETAAESASGVAKSSVSMDNHGKYTINMNGTYVVISRIDNTVIYATTSSDNKDTMKELLEQMGY